MEDAKQNTPTPTDTSPQKSVGRRIAKLFFKTIAIIVVVVVALNLLVYALFSIPAIQKKASGIAVNILQEKLKTKIEIGGIRLHLFSQATLKNIFIADQSQDTLLYAQTLNAKLDPWKLLSKKKLSITQIKLDNFKINVSKKDSLSDFNFQFIISAFTSNQPDTTTTKNSLDIAIGSLQITNGTICYDMLSKPQTPGVFNASHLKLADFNADIQLPSVNPKKLNIQVTDLRAKEASGLSIDHLGLSLRSDNNLLICPEIQLISKNSKLTLDNVLYNTADQSFSIETGENYIQPKDFAPILPNLRFLDQQLSLQTKITGKLPQVKVEKLLINYGKNNLLNATASIGDYSQYAKTPLALSINKLKLDSKAIGSFIQLGDSTFTLPAPLKRLKQIEAKATLSGCFSDFKFDLDTWAPAGEIKFTAKGSADSMFNDYKVKANLSIPGFKFAKLLPRDSIATQSDLVTDLKIDVKQHPHEKIDANVYGELKSFTYNKIKIQHLFLDAFYNKKNMGGKLYANWKIGTVFAHAEMSQDKVPDVSAGIKIKDLHVDRFYQKQGWTDPRLSFRFDGKLKGTDIDQTTGYLKIDSIDLHAKEFSYKPVPVLLTISRQDKIKFIHLTSPILTGELSGNYQFKALSHELNHFMHSYLPDVFVLNLPKKRAKDKVKKRIPYKPKNNFKFTVHINSTEDIDSLFSLPVNIIKPGQITGEVNTIDHHIEVTTFLPEIDYGYNTFANTKLHIFNPDSVFHINTASSIYTEDGLFGLKAEIAAHNDSISTLLHARSDTSSLKMKGNIRFKTTFFRTFSKELLTKVDIVPSEVEIKDLKIGILRSSIANNGERTIIHNFGISVDSVPYMNIDGSISNSNQDSLHINFNHAEIEHLLKLAKINNIKAKVDGAISVSNMKKPRIFTDNFTIKDILIAKDTLGDLQLHSIWDSPTSGIKVDATLKKNDNSLSEFRGVYNTKTDSLDFRFKINRMSLDWALPLATNYLNKISGTVSSDVSIKGTTTSPEFKGFIGFDKFKFGLDYTNVAYQVSDTINIAPNRIGFDNLELQDPEGNKATVNATLTHKNFKDFKYKLDLDTKNLMVLNTQDRVDSLFYGKLYVGGQVNIEGSKKGINMDMNLINGKKSELNVVIPQTAEAQDFKSVEYINVPKPKNGRRRRRHTVAQAKPLPVFMKIRLNVTPDIKFGVVIDKSSGDYLTARGKGDLSFTYDMTQDNMNLLGNYSLTEGNVKVNLKNISKMEFKIKPDSKIYFMGDPLKTKFDITAYRPVKADLTTLDNSFASDNIATKTPVNCLLGISGDINQMNLKYDIELPEANDDVKRKVNSLISTEELKIRQFAYLLVTGKFYSSSEVGNSTFGSGMWTNIASSTLSNGLDALLGNILGDKWQIGTNLESNDGTLNNMNMSVNVSAKLLDDKLRISTNLGYSTDQSDAQTNAFIGDFDVEYQLNHYWMIKAYNHTNNKYYRLAPTTQSIGVVYTKEAPTLRLFFSSWQKKLHRIIVNAKMKRMAEEAKKKQEETNKPVTKEEKPKETNPLIIIQQK